MVRNWLNHWLIPNQVAGVEVRILSNGEFSCEYVIIGRHKDEIRVIATSAQAMSLQELTTALPATLPVALAVEGNSILIKRINSVPSEGEIDLKKVVPGIQEQDFCYQTCPAVSGAYVAVARKTMLDDLMHGFDGRNHSIIYGQLSFIGLSKLFPLLNVPDSVFYSSAWQIEIENQLISLVTPQSHTETQNTLLSQILDSRHLLAYSAALNTIANLGQDLSNTNIFITQRRNFYIDKIFKLSLYAALLTLFLSLLLNTYFFFNWSEKLEKQSMFLAVNESKVAALDSLQKVYKRQEAFFTKNGFLNPSKSAWFADQIAASCTDGIKLDLIHVNPPLNVKNRNQPPAYQTDLIRIKGQSQNSLDLNTWLKKLKTIHWVQDIKVQPYRENNAGVGEFEMEIIIAYPKHR